MDMIRQYDSDSEESIGVAYEDEPLNNWVEKEYINSLFELEEGELSSSSDSSTTSSESSTTTSDSSTTSSSSCSDTTHGEPEFLDDNAIDGIPEFHDDENGNDEVHDDNNAIPEFHDDNDGKVVCGANNPLGLDMPWLDVEGKDPPKLSVWDRLGQKQKRRRRNRRKGKKPSPGHPWERRWGPPPPPPTGGAAAAI